MIRSVTFTKEGIQKGDLTADEIQKVLHTSETFLWISLESASKEETSSILEDIFHFHPLVIEDCLSTGYQTPKVDDFGQYLFIIANALQPFENFTKIETSEIDLLLGENYLVTCSFGDQMTPICKMWQQIDKDQRLHEHGVDLLCQRILDFLVDDYMPLLDQMDDEIDWLEDTVLDKPDPSVLERIMLLKHSLMSIRRLINPMREVMNTLSRDEFTVIKQKTRIYFRDIYDHLVRIQDLSESIRDIVTGAMDIYLNSISNRLNMIMKALTVVSTIFLPLTFIAGVYGMNFRNIPELSWQNGYFIIWGVFILIGLGMLLLFKRIGWF